ncbi:hypothetical protein WOLCODRAFT_145775 [Wolfiporia cocos MD-104 SS10]|uniref:Allantoin permease n=1 Tax=Wolfiporia cocos (strain MD-104) TaxID=742152 RepID=A0A2H3IZC0_WOLCO|nr:hypothetical protein WOLCODRAFT_145775 [Wolfiporia cocos MD-104 SS10]
MTSAGLMRRLLKKLEVPNQDEREADRWHNFDLMPVEPARRTWDARQFVELWILVNMNISGYQTGSSLVSSGLTWWQAVVCIIFGDILAAIFVTLNSTSGAFYHIGYPAITRIVFGMNGSYFALANRILLSMVWFAVQAWNGGLCVEVCLRAVFPHHIDNIPNPFPESTGMNGAEFMCYVLFMLICAPLTYIRPHKLNTFFKICSVIVFVNQLAMLIWALATMKGGLASSELKSEVSLGKSALAWAICNGIMAQIGSIAAGILNDNDFTRFAKTPERLAIVAQARSYNVPCHRVPDSLVWHSDYRSDDGAVWRADLESPSTPTRCTEGRWPGFPRVHFCGFAWMIAQIGINVPGNLIAGGVDVAALWPKYINLRRGAYLILLVSIAVNPWQLVSTSSVFLNVLGAYGVFLSPMIGMMVSHYYVIQKRYFKIPDIYIGDSRSIYWYTKGVNWRAFVAFSCGVAPCITGFVGAVSPHIVSAPAARMYDINFVLGFTVSFVVNWILHCLFPVPSQITFVRNMEKAGAPTTLDGLSKFMAMAAASAAATEEHESIDAKKRSGEITPQVYEAT